jgi:hypothetical protein
MSACQPVSPHCQPRKLFEYLVAKRKTPTSRRHAQPDDQLDLGDEIARGANGAVYTAVLCGTAVCAKVRRGADAGPQSLCTGFGAVRVRQHPLALCCICLSFGD